MSARDVHADLPPLQPGRFAETSIELAPGRAPVENAPLELGLIPPLAPLLSALCAGRAYRIRSLSFEYVAPECLVERASCSAQVSKLLAGGKALRISLLVFRGARVAARGTATLELETALAQQPAAASGVAERGTTSNTRGTALYG